MPTYNAYQSFVDNQEGLKAIFRKRRGDSDPIPDVVEIPCAGYIPSILGRIMSSLDPCYVAPIEGKKEEMKKEREILLIFRVAEGDEGEEELEKVYGDTKFYCPVTLATKNQLIPGDPKLTVRWKVCKKKHYYFTNLLLIYPIQNYLYQFAGSDEMYNFLMAPTAYLPPSISSFSPMLPSPRLAVIGSKSSGKTSIAKCILSYC